MVELSIFAVSLVVYAGVRGGVRGDFGTAHCCISLTLARPPVREDALVLTGFVMALELERKTEVGTVLDPGDVMTT